MRADITLYINFALHAVLGKLGEADTILRFAGEAIRRVADEIAAECPIELAPIYRGILLDPAEPFRVGSSLSFLSWSEDRDVALWFACPRSLINEPLVQRNSALCGYVAELPAPRSRVLFHHSWASALGGLACFALAHVAWLKSEGWEAQITQGTSMDLFLASTLNIVAKWNEVGRAYQEQGIDRVLLKKGARASVPGAKHPVVAVSTQQDRFNFCFQQVDTAPTTVDALTTCALDMVGTTAREEVHLDFPMVDLLVRDDAKYMHGLHAGTNVITQAAEQLRLELNEVGGRASAAAEIRVTRGIRKTPTIKMDGPFVVAIYRNGAPQDADTILFAAYVDRDAWKKPAEGRI